VIFNLICQLRINVGVIRQIYLGYLKVTPLWRPPHGHWAKINNGITACENVDCRQLAEDRAQFLRIKVRVP